MAKKKRISRSYYQQQKKLLQIELLKVQLWAKDQGQRIVVLFEGRDAAGKGGVIKRITERLNPRIACKDKWRRIALLEELSRFLEDYRDAWQRFCDGERDVLFPDGTYEMRVLFGVRYDFR